MNRYLRYDPATHPWRHNDHYGSEQSYKEGMEWLDPCSLVEDWGCALCYAKTYRKGDYRGVDGTPGKADVIADLTTYKSNVPGIFLRHVLEHNPTWRDILRNALESFTERMSLILFLPLARRDTKPRPSVHAGGPPMTQHLCGHDLFTMIDPYLRHKSVIKRENDKRDIVLLLEK